MAATAASMAGILTLGHREARDPNALVSLIVYVFGGAVAVLAGLGSVIRHEGRWSTAALAAIPAILIIAWLQSH
ncbi:MAG: hypothetical protein R2729_09665 [Bryobacteraceae bacterium]